MDMQTNLKYFQLITYWLDACCLTKELCFWLLWEISFSSVAESVTKTGLGAPVTLFCRSLPLSGSTESVQADQLITSNAPVPESLPPEGKHSLLMPLEQRFTMLVMPEQVQWSSKKVQHATCPLKCFRNVQGLHSIRLLHSIDKVPFGHGQVSKNLVLSCIFPLEGCTAFSLFT